VLLLRDVLTGRSYVGASAARNLAIVRCSPSKDRFGFYLAGFLPKGVRLSGYSGDASDLPQTVLQDFLDAVAAGEATVPLAKTYAMDEIATAHDDMEHNRVAGKLVVATGR
jgi:NADPH:quinone reductase-like Zn-dependent oxidoreductase